MKAARVSWSYTGMRIFALATLFLALGLATACGGSDQRFSEGRSVGVLIEPVPVKVYDQIVFMDGGQSRVIRPTATNRQLAALSVTIRNVTSTTTRILVNAEAAELGDRRSQRISALPPFENAVIADSVDNSNPDRILVLDSSLPDERFLWGEVSLDRDFQIQGWIIFDVPKGLRLGTFWWNQIESVVIDI
ncbi:MAG: hypothetical protein L0177_01185 [Chloroflexi bacterium]|nr:hypothetical protein [Chloroflexota bacterium]